MIYIFEDHQDADISILFKSAYSQTIAQKFIYAQGNGNLEAIIMQQLHSIGNKDMIAVFMDMIPGNKNCYSLYNKFRLLSRKNNYAIIIIPITCAEYYMLKSLKNDNFFVNIQEKNCCVQKRPHVLSSIMNYPDKAQYCKNFEKYCKYVLKYNVSKDCIKPYNKTKNMHGQYYRENCKCSMSDSNCMPASIYDKSLSLLYEYPCIPEGSNAPNVTTLSDDQMWQIHRILVDEYNKFVDEYIKADYTRSGIYKKIKYIK